jgi:hypothetical protein
MFTHPTLTLDLALALHQERIAEAERWRQVARTRRARHESATQPIHQRLTSIALPDHRFQNRQTFDLADWLVRVGDTVVQYATTELDGHRRPALGALVDGLLDAAREGGADVTLHVESDDVAVVLLRILGRLAASTSGDSIPVSRRRARMLRTALDELVEGSIDQVAEPRADQAA